MGEVMLSMISLLTFLSKLWGRKTGGDIHYLGPHLFYSKEILSRFTGPDLFGSCFEQPIVKKKYVWDKQGSLNIDWELDDIKN